MSSHQELSAGERGALVLAVPGMLVAGLGGLTGLAVPPLLGHTGTESYYVYIDQCLGASSLGYAVGLILALRRGDWLASSVLVVGTCVYGLAALCASLLELASGNASGSVYAVAVYSLGVAIATGWVLVRRGFQTLRRPPDLPGLGSAALMFVMLAALVTGLPLLLAPGPMGSVLGYRLPQLFVFRLVGAATLGYLAMGILVFTRTRALAASLRPTAWAVLTGGGLALLAILFGFAYGPPSLSSLVILLGSLVITISSALAVAQLRTP